MTTCNGCGKEVEAATLDGRRLCDACIEHDIAVQKACRNGDHNFVECDEWERPALIAASSSANMNCEHMVYRGPKMDRVRCSRKAKYQFVYPRCTQHTPRADRVKKNAI